MPPSFRQQYIVRAASSGDDGRHTGVITILRPIIAACEGTVAASSLRWFWGRELSPFSHHRAFAPKKVKTSTRAGFASRGSGVRSPIASTSYKWEPNGQESHEGLGTTGGYGY